MDDTPPAAPTAPRGLVLLATAAGDAELQALLPALRRVRLAVLRPGSAAALEALLRTAGDDAPRIGLYGGGRGTALALRLAGAWPGRVAAVVACNGRPDHAAGALARVQAATLLLVGAAPAARLAAGQQALARLAGARRLEVVPGRVGDAGRRQAVAELAAQWFARHLGAGTWG